MSGRLGPPGSFLSPSLCLALLVTFLSTAYRMLPAPSSYTPIALLDLYIRHGHPLYCPFPLLSSAPTSPRTSGDIAAVSLSVSSPTTLLHFFKFRLYITSTYASCCCCATPYFNLKPASQTTYPSLLHPSFITQRKRFVCLRKRCQKPRCAVHTLPLLIVLRPRSRRRPLLMHAALPRLSPVLSCQTEAISQEAVRRSLELPLSSLVRLLRLTWPSQMTCLVEPYHQPPRTQTQTQSQSHRQTPDWAWLRHQV
jgi:hypothetical protein